MIFDIVKLVQDHNHDLLVRIVNKSNRAFNTTRNPKAKPRLKKKAGNYITGVDIWSAACNNVAEDQFARIMTDSMEGNVGDYLMGLQRYVMEVSRKCGIQTGKGHSYGSAIRMNADKLWAAMIADTKANVAAAEALADN